MTCFPTHDQANLKYVGRDGLALALGLLGERSTRLDGVRVLDIRRHDERALYGSIHGESTLPQLASTHECMLAPASYCQQHAPAFYCQERTLS